MAESPDKITDDDEEKELEKFLFGHGHGLFKLAEKEVLSPKEVSISNEAAWIDEDDDNAEVPLKLRKFAKSGEKLKDYARRKYEETMGIPKWGVDDKSDAEGDDDDMLKRCGNVVAKKLNESGGGLPKDKIRIDRVTDLNKDTRKCEGPFINAVEFHPTSTVALVAGVSGVVSIVKVDGVTNAKLQCVKFDKFPVKCARFTQDGEQFIVGSHATRSFHYYDMMSGKSVNVPIHHAIGQTNMAKFEMSPDGQLIVALGRFGTLHLLSARSKEWICDLKMNSEVSSVAFNSDGTRMFSYGDEGKIYEWDVPNRKLVRRMNDEGAFEKGCVAVSPDNGLLASGSGSGIVNVYGMSGGDKDTPRLLKIVKNLRTPCHTLRFNPTSEILAACSSDTNEAIKLIHFPSMTVFSHFPNAGHGEIRKPRVLSFSPNGGFMAIGNNTKDALLFRLKHYKNY